MHIVDALHTRDISTQDGKLFLLDMKLAVQRFVRTKMVWESPWEGLIAKSGACGESIAGSLAAGRLRASPIPDSAA